MSELTPTPEELVEEIGFTVQDAEVIPTPVDPTLSHEGEAADAKATGDAIDAVLDDLQINAKRVVDKSITLYGTDIHVSNQEGAQTIAEALESVSSSTAADIMYDPENLVSVKDAIDGITEDLDTELSESEIDAIIDEVFAEEGE